jgi:hypothetical protein
MMSLATTRASRKRIAQRRIPRAVQTRCTEATMIAQGFTIERLRALVGAGPATARPVRVAGKPVEVVQVYISETGVTHATDDDPATGRCTLTEQSRAMLEAMRLYKNV